MMDSNQERPENDRLWLAFQYVHGEMSVEDAESFEQQMLEDGDLCAAVAETSLLMSAIAISGESTEASQCTQRHVPARPVASRVAAILSALCCCAGLIVFLSQTSMVPSAEFGDAAGMSEADMLVAAWADTAISTERPEEDETDVADELELVIPEWMLAGLSGVDIDETDQPQLPELSDEHSGLL